MKRKLKTGRQNFEVDKSWKIIPKHERFSLQ